MVWFAVETALDHALIAHGDTVLVLAGAPRPGVATGRDGTGAATAELVDPVGGAATDVLRIVHVD